jgi:hypothetical protein
MHANRSLVFWGVALVTAGAVALAIQNDLVSGAAARDAWRLWPVVLIVIGIAVISARTPFALVGTLVAALVVGGMGGTLAAGWPDGFSIGCGGEASNLATESGSFTGAASAEVELDFSCGELAVAMAAGSGWSVDARYAADAEPEIESDDGTLRVEAERGGVFGFRDARQEWDVTLPTDVGLALMISANAASSTLDLADASLSRLELDANAGEVTLDLSGATADALGISANAGSVELTVDGSTRFDGSVDTNAGSFELCVTDDALVEITVADANVSFSHNLDASGLARSGDTWRSGDGPADVVLDVEGNAASFTYTSGGCS